LFSNIDTLGAKSMTASSEKSVEELRDESERTREVLASTVTELRDRVGGTATQIKAIVSPAHIKQEIRGFVRQERESLVDTVQRKAKENPLQVAAVAAAVAYPALGLLRTIPAPLWLIGAGMFLTSKRGQQLSGEVKARVDDAVQQGTDKVADFAGSVRSDLEDRVAGARSGVGEIRDAVTSAVGGLTDKTRVAFHDAREAVTSAQDTTAQTTAAADRLSSTVSETTNAMKRRADEAARTSRHATTDFINENALLVAGIGAVVGAVIAASVPPSEAENRLFGAGSKKLKVKARDAAAQGIENAGDLAAEAVGSVAAAAAREGLDAAGVQGALNKMAGSVRAVAERGVDAVIGSKQQQDTARQFEQAPVERNPS
jgi:ElaB/YqjD/DUF883 family membrane-anchored ribosome-binding protein